MAISCSGTKPVAFFDKANALKPTALLLLPVFAVNNSLLGNPINGSNFCKVISKGDFEEMRK